MSDVKVSTIQQINRIWKDGSVTTYTIAPTSNGQILLSGGEEDVWLSLPVGVWECLIESLKEVVSEVRKHSENGG